MRKKDKNFEKKEKKREKSAILIKNSVNFEYKRAFFTKSNAILSI